MSAKIKYTDEPVGPVKVVPDFLPAPEDLVFKEDTVKVTIALSHVRRGGRDRHVAVLGHVECIREAARRLGRRFFKGLGQSRRLYLARV